MFYTDYSCLYNCNSDCTQVCHRPIVHLLDTPGVLPPTIESVETGMKLALCGNFTVGIIALLFGNVDVMLSLLTTFITKIFLHHV